MHHHEHLFGCFVAWLCQGRNKAEALNYVAVVTSNLNAVAQLLRARDDGLGRTRISTVGDWKDPYAMQLSWQCGEKRRIAVRPLCVERLLGVEGEPHWTKLCPQPLGCTLFAAPHWRRWPRRHFSRTQPCPQSPSPRTRTRSLC